VAAQNRFVYYPDHLVRMPGPGQDMFDQIWAIFTEPIFKGFIWSILSEYRSPKRPQSLDDESVGSFLERRTGSTNLADNIVSAVLHGIYAGDVNQLSMRSLLPSVWHAEAMAGSVVIDMVQKMSSGLTPMRYEDAILLQELQGQSNNGMGTELQTKMSGTSVYSFKKGIGALSEALETSLRANPNVTIKPSTQVQNVQYDGQSDSVTLSTNKNQTPAYHSNVISTISGRSLSYLTNTTTLPSLQFTHAVTVMVVNLYFTDPGLLREHGFGYLLPRALPLSQNPERALGVVFDSDATIGQDSIPGTKLTVMLGGHWWDDFSVYPDEEEGAAMAKAVVKRHLGIEDEPAMVNVGLQKDCIPQYTVGHDARMGKAHQELMREFKGKLAVAGNSYSGVGLNDCVRNARDVALNVAHYQGPGGLTGLEKFVGEQRWVNTKLERAGA